MLNFLYDGWIYSNPPVKNVLMTVPTRSECDAGRCQDRFEIALMPPPYADLDPWYYHDPGVLEEERRQLFSRCWVFVCLANEVSQPNDYVLASVGSLEVIVQNGGGRLRAFVNCCSHRHCRIHDERRGKRRLVCPYHGWSYDDDGVPVGIPDPENFPHVCANRSGFALTQLELDRVGQFVFVRTSPGGVTLAAYLGAEMHSFLSSASAGMGEVLDDSQGVFDANWKLVLENAVEHYHVQVVHPATFSSSRQFSTADENEIALYRNGHSRMVSVADPDWLARWQALARTLGRWPFAFDRYVHVSLFPNLTVTLFMGYLFHIQYFHPAAVDRTTLHSRICSVLCERQTEEGAGIMRSVHAEAIKFAHRVFEEDRRICGLVQRGVGQARQKAVLGCVAETRVRHFQEAYLRSLRGDQDSRQINPVSSVHAG